MVNQPVMPELTHSGHATRHANMAARRQRILDTARKIIAEEGFDALNVRQLAERAGISVPTIYNLIGNKSALIAQLFEDTISPFEHLQYIGDDEDPVAAPIVFFAKIVATMRENENYYRAEFLARENMREVGDQAAIAIGDRSIRIAIDACEQAQQAGLIRGQISARQLGGQIDHNFRLAYHDWAHSVISLDAFQNRVTAGTYLCLAADATVKYHPQFIEKLKSLEELATVILLRPNK